MRRFVEDAVATAAASSTNGGIVPRCQAGNSRWIRSMIRTTSRASSGSTGSGPSPRMAEAAPA